jgi:hypothetical protein
VRLVLKNLASSNSLAFVSQSESAELGNSLELFNRDRVPSCDSDATGGERLDELRRLLGLHVAASMVFLLTRNDILDHALVSEGVTVHDARVSL